MKEMPISKFKATCLAVIEQVRKTKRPAARDIRISHTDPADRLIAATARYYDVRLVTADERLLLGTGFSTLAN
jgi:PIN domain nuclease of toxin-antitoxin system